MWEKGCCWSGVTGVVCNRWCTSGDDVWRELDPLKLHSTPRPSAPLRKEQVTHTSRTGDTSVHVRRSQMCTGVPTLIWVGAYTVWMGNICPKLTPVPGDRHSRVTTAWESGVHCCTELATLLKWPVHALQHVLSLCCWNTCSSGTICLQNWARSLLQCRFPEPNEMFKLSNWVGFLFYVHNKISKLILIDIRMKSDMLWT